jgi:hypothetical protein
MLGNLVVGWEKVGVGREEKEEEEGLWEGEERLGVDRHGENKNWGGTYLG